MAEAPRKMIIDHAHGLHKGINDCRPDKPETAFLEVFGNRFTQWCRCRNVSHFPPAVLHRLAVGEAPQIVGESVLLHDLQIGLGVADRRLYLAAMADNVAIQQ